jgi:type I restriction enzyme S subunit
MEWSQVQLDDVVSMHGGGTPSKRNPSFWNGDIPWVSPKDMSNRDVSDSINHITQEAVDKSSTKIVPSGSVLLVVRSGILVRKVPVGIARRHLAINQDMKALVPDLRLLDSDFLAYLFEARQSLLLAGYVKRGATVHSLQVDRLRKMVIPLPPLSEQRRIAELLGQADILRKKRVKADVKATRLLPALFYKMFGDPATNPMGWPTEPLGNLGELDRGRSRHRPRNDPKLLGGPYPFIQTGDVANSWGYIRSYSATYSELGLAQSKMWPAGTLCITIAANIAASAILGFDACFPDSVVGFTPGLRVNSAYIRLFLEHLRPVLEKAAPQVAQKNINLKILRDIPVPVPPKALQNKFRAHHEAIVSLNDAQIKVRDQIEGLWKVLLHRAFTGDLTAKWREAHMAELLVEIEHQAKAISL